LHTYSSPFACRSEARGRGVNTQQVARREALVEHGAGVVALVKPLEPAPARPADVQASQLCELLEQLRRDPRVLHRRGAHQRPSFVDPQQPHAVRKTLGRDARARARIRIRTSGAHAVEPPLIMPGRRREKQRAVLRGRKQGQERVKRSPRPWHSCQVTLLLLRKLHTNLFLSFFQVFSFVF
jgi:hypothetical protein